MVVPIEKTMKITAHLPIPSNFACAMMSGGMTPVIKQTRNNIRLTNTADRRALVSTPKNSPMPKKKRQRKR